MLLGIGYTVCTVTVTIQIAEVNERDVNVMLITSRSVVQATPNRGALKPSKNQSTI